MTPAVRATRRRTCASSPTTSIDAAASIGACGPSGLPPCSPTIDPDIVALQEVIGPGLTGPGHAEQLGAALGMGWVMAPTRELRRHQFGNVVLSRYPDPRTRAARPVVEDLRAARQPARRDRSRRRPHRCRSTTCTSGRRCSSAAIRRRGWRRGFTTGACRARRSCSATSTSGGAGSWRTCWPSGSRASTSTRTCKRRRTYPGFFPVLHLDHIYFERGHRGPAHRAAADAAGAGRVGSPAARGGRPDQVRVRRVQA